MNPDAVRQALVEVIYEFAVLSGEAAIELSGDTRPMTDLSDFDSLRCVEVATHLFAKFDLELKEDVTLFFDAKASMARSIDEISKAIVEKYSDEVSNDAKY
jgi:acyl carrier protein